MDNLEFIYKVEDRIKSEYNEDILTANYKYNNINMPLKEFLEKFLVRFIKQGADENRIFEYIKHKVIPNVEMKLSKESIINKIIEAFPQNELDGAYDFEGEEIAFEDYIKEKYIDFVDAGYQDDIVRHIENLKNIALNVRKRYKKERLLEEAMKEIPEEVLNGMYELNGRSISFREYLNTTFIHGMDYNSSSSAIADYIKDKLVRFVKVESYEERKSKELEEENRQYVLDFIESREDFVSYVPVNESTTVPTVDYLMSKVPLMDENHLVPFGESKKTIEDAYQILLNNTYRPVNLIDKAEICEDAIKYIDEEILASTVEVNGVSISFKDYVTKVLPIDMISATKIKNGEEVVEITDYIKEAIDRQRTKIDEQVEKFNRTGENPSLLSEISVAIGENKDVEVTAEIPIVESTKLTSDEVSSLQALPANLFYADPNQHYREMLNDIKEAINNTNNTHDLENKERMFSEIATKALEEAPTEEVEQLIESITELLAVKKNSIIKIESNKEEYIDHMIDELSAIEKTIRSLNSVDAFSDIDKRIRTVEDEINSKEIHDIKVKEDLKRVRDKYNKAHINYLNGMESIDKSKNEVVSKINDFISQIRRNYHSLNVTKDDREFQRISINIDVQTEAVTNEIDNALKSRLISEMEAEDYKKQINELNEKNKINNQSGYGY